jgi:hypothetical protein
MIKEVIIPNVGEYQDRPKAEVWCVLIRRTEYWFTGNLSTNSMPRTVSYSGSRLLLKGSVKGNIGLRDPQECENEPMLNGQK